MKIAKHLHGIGLKKESKYLLEVIKRAQELALSEEGEGTQEDFISEEGTEEENGLLPDSSGVLFIELGTSLGELHKANFDDILIDNSKGTLSSANGNFIQSSYNYGLNLESDLGINKETTDEQALAAAKSYYLGDLASKFSDDEFVFNYEIRSDETYPDNPEMWKDDFAEIKLSVSKVNQLISEGLLTIDSDEEEGELHLTLKRSSESDEPLDPESNPEFKEHIDPMKEMYDPEDKIASPLFWVKRPGIVRR